MERLAAVNCVNAMRGAYGEGLGEATPPEGNREPTEKTGLVSPVCENAGALAI